ncbi:CcoQ/FixQ family Cbb3-type cytochrome c oxidase assembly chaperone [Hyalangium versicolor]|uniref:CcoQ/FixQ family Cbb3-type cytochrome c oxidase assembly chaperone n=1 Tax=Hyalangium versicolor TaxID=2861190 RepID=UPI001CCF417F|nr:CcoQ/FixQ family Cbb3-type cytochrome c oxidase assembly chaperone [Hyalangium versicolor]
MYRQFYQGMDWTHLPLFALLFFLAVFLGVVAWLFLARRSQDFEAAALLPLLDQGPSRQDSGGTGHE